MFYRENGQFKTSYAADQQIFTIAQDKWFVWGVIAFAALAVPMLADEYMFRAILIPFLVLSLAAQFLCDWAFLRIGWFTNYSSSGSVSVAKLEVLGWVIDSPVEKYLFCLAFVVVFAVIAKNLTRAAIGRQWMAIRDMDVAAEVIGIRPMFAKLSAFAVSSFFVGVAGALWGFVYLGSWEPAAFSVDRSFQLLFMVIIGGMGSVMGSFFGAAFIVILPIFLNQFLPFLGSLVGVNVSTAGVSHAEFIIFGSLIIFFLIVEPHGLARLWSIAKQKLRLWPFPH